MPVETATFSMAESAAFNTQLSAQFKSAGATDAQLAGLQAKFDSIVASVGSNPSAVGAEVKALASQNVNTVREADVLGNLAQLGANQAANNRPINLIPLAVADVDASPSSNNRFISDFVKSTMEGSTSMAKGSPRPVAA